MLRFPFLFSLQSVLLEHVGFNVTLDTVELQLKKIHPISLGLSQKKKSKVITRGQSMPEFSAIKLSL